MSIGIPDDYPERVYAGWLGKIIGVRHGAHIENWSAERIERTYGEITGYVNTFKNFPADDDTNGPVAFLQALEDFTHTREITAEQMGRTLLNYAPDGHGFFWWGGYGISTEHTAYLNLKNGIPAPRSGSIEQNGVTVAEQIGGQIFIDIWGFLAPGNPRLAAEYAEKMASVTHDGNGIYGGMFIAACIAAAFVETDVRAILEAGLSVIPADCDYTRMVRAVMQFHRDHAEEGWRSCFEYVRTTFGYDKYPGNCPIVSNSAVIVLALLYSGGEFSAAINICNMCGWDTDCNVGNVGAIAGVRGGLAGIDPSWRKPINDFLCCSTVIGKMNIQDVPAFASRVARLGYRIAGQPIPDSWRAILEEKGLWLHFEYPGSTHGIRVEPPAGFHMTAQIANTTEQAAIGTRSLKIGFDWPQPGYGHRIFYKTYYRPADFDHNSRYDPSFSPVAYPGNTMTLRLLQPEYDRTPVDARLYVKDGNGNVSHYSERTRLVPGQWQAMSFTIPQLEGACLEEVGVECIPIEGSSSSLIVYLDDFRIGGKASYSLHFDKERMEDWNWGHKEVSQFTYLRGMWYLEEGRLNGRYYGESAECYTGDPDWRDYEFTSTIVPQSGDTHLALFRVQGATRSYAVGFTKDNTFTLFKKDQGYFPLASANWAWKPGEAYTVGIKAVDGQFTISVNGQTILSHTDEQPWATGQIGFANGGGSHTTYTSFTFHELD